MRQKKEVRAVVHGVKSGRQMRERKVVRCDGGRIWSV